MSDCNLLDVGNWIRVTGANDLEVPCLGYIEVEIRISGILVPQVGVLVVKDPVDPQGLERKQKIPGLLGSNFFSALKKCMAQQTCAVNIDEKISQMLSLYEMSVDSNDHGTSFVKVAGSLRVKVPASSMVVVQGITMLRSDGKPYSVAVQALAGVTGSLPRNIIVVDTFAKLVNGRVPVRVVNLGQEDVWLEPKSRLGLAHFVDVVREHFDGPQYTVDAEDSEIVVRLEKIEVSTAAAVCDKIDALPFKVDIDKTDLSVENERHIASLFMKYKEFFVESEDDRLH